MDCAGTLSQRPDSLLQSSYMWQSQAMAGVTQQPQSGEPQGPIILVYLTERLCMLALVTSVL